MNRFRIQLETFRAVHKADIELNGITVLAGENSTGKSTISKFFYHFLKTTMTFEDVINEEFIEFCGRVQGRLVRIIYKDIEDIEDKDIKDKDIKDIRNFIYSNPFRIFKRNLGNNINNSEEIKKLTEEFKQNIESIARYKNTNKLPLIGLERMLESEDIPVQKDEPSNVFHQIINLIDKKNRERENKIKNREEKYIVKKVNAILHSEDNKYKYDILIDDISLRKKNDVIEDIEKFNIIYIQPTNNVESVLQDNDSLEKYLLVENKEKFVLDEYIIKFFTSEIFLNGDIHVLDNKIFYVQNNTLFPIEDCASGVNSIAQLYLLYKNGYIDENSVIIIDEPEVHLHPSWIVEYARLIILLRKKVRVTFLIATHSPDMVRSITELSEKEDIGKEYNFYLSELHNKDGVYTYNFKVQEQEINRIFSSYNKSLDKLDEYTEDEEDGK